MRVVLDTNTVLSAILFPKGRLAWLREVWGAGRIIPVGNRATVQELIRVLAYPKFKLSQEEIEVSLNAYLPYTEMVAALPKDMNNLPSCREDVYSAVGQTPGGRYLIVFFVLKAGARALVISARDIKPKERRQYAKK